MVKRGAVGPCALDGTPSPVPGGHAMVVDTRVGGSPAWQTLSRAGSPQGKSNCWAPDRTGGRPDWSCAGAAKVVRPRLIDFTAVQQCTQSLAWFGCGW